MRVKRKRELKVLDLDAVATIQHRHLPFCLELDEPITLRGESPLPDKFSFYHQDPYADDALDVNNQPPALTPALAKIKKRDLERARADALIPRAPLLRELSDAELSRPSAAAGFQMSDGTLLGPGLTVTHKFWPGARQGIVGTDHVHVAHPSRRRRWVVRMLRSKRSFEGAYFGVTCASAFQHRGAAYGRDLFGNMIRGETPLVLTGMWDTPIETRPGVCAGSAIRITVDLNAQTWMWEAFARASIEEGEEPVHSISSPLWGSTCSSGPRWRSARLWVSLRGADDCVSLERAESV
tara:strand:- start:499 stop:1383 length:885 start_codon:yes stop_codon:yes gene_type:complete